MAGAVSADVRSTTSTQGRCFIQGRRFLLSYLPGLSGVLFCCALRTDATGIPLFPYYRSLDGRQSAIGVFASDSSEEHGAAFKKKSSVRLIHTVSFLCFGSFVCSYSRTCFCVNNSNYGVDNVSFERTLQNVEHSFYELTMLGKTSVTMRTIT